MMDINKYENNKDNDITIDDLKNKLLENYNLNKFKIDKSYEKKLYNEISIIANYKFKDKNKDQRYQTKLYTELSQIMIDDFTIYLLKDINEFISSKYEIENKELKTRRNIEEQEEFTSEIENINEDRLFGWLLEELLYEVRDFKKLLLVESFSEFLRVEKIVSNSKKQLNDIKIDSKDKRVLEISQVFYDFRDKLYKNKFISTENEIKNTLREIIKDSISNDEQKKWKSGSNYLKKTKKYNFKVGSYTETKEIKMYNKKRNESSYKLRRGDE